MYGSRTHAFCTVEELGNQRFGNHTEGGIVETCFPALPPKRKIYKYI